MNKTVLLLGLIVVSKFLLAQSVTFIEGKVMDATTKESLPGASVYLAQTTHGIATEADGGFLLKNISNGKYELTVSMVGYKTFSKPMVFEGKAIVGFMIYLQQETVMLNQVEVKAKHRLTNEYYKFEKIFFGETLNSKKCKITNPLDIFAHQEGDKLIAKAKKPIEIINNALGYRVFYELKEFVFNKSDTTAYILGTARFEYLIPKNNKQELKWNKERDRAYYGSVEHFIRALKVNELKKNHFTLYNSNRKEVSGEKLINIFKENEVQFKGKLTLVFTGEPAEVSYDPLRRPQVSVLKFNGNPVKIYDNGVFEKYQDILLYGYLGWSSRIAEVIPLGYEPFSKLN